MRAIITQHVAACLAALACAANVTAGTATAPADVFARVGDDVVTMQALQDGVQVAARRKFYHGSIPPAQLAALQREVASQLVDNLLLAQEARRRKLQPDTAAVERTLADYEARYRTSAEWQKQRAALLPALREHLEGEDLRAQLERQVRAIPAPDVAHVQQYYRTHADKFTEPERARVALILLKVDPSAPLSAWDQARSDAQLLVRRLRGGADFAALAHERSADASAQQGGDMGYLHRGMLADPAQQAVDTLRPGAISEPVTLLQGVAVFRLEDRRAGKLNPYEKVEARARELLQRELSEAAWQGLLTRLRSATRISVDEARLLPLAAVAGSPAR